MTFFKNLPSWQLPEAAATSETLYRDRRRFLKSIIGAGIGVTATTLLGCQKSEAQIGDLESTFNLPEIQPLPTNPAFAQLDRPITNQSLAASYNNFYEFGGNKSIWRAAQNLPTENWQVEVTGLIKNPRTYDLDRLKKIFLWKNVSIAFVA
jgi:sulfoxide reductase catalytic subunit YedY